VKRWMPMLMIAGGLVAVVSLACAAEAPPDAAATQPAATQPGATQSGRDAETDVGGVHWLTSWEQARRQAQQQNKPIFVHFTTDWCSWCRKIEQETYPTPVAQAALSGYVPLRLNCTDSDSPEGQRCVELLKAFGGTGYPFLVMVTPDGVVLDTISGYVPAAPFAMALDRSQGLYQEWLKFQQWSKTADTSSYEYAYRSMEINARLGRTEQAAEAAGQILKLDPENKQGHKAAAALALLRQAQAAATTQPATDQQAEQIARWTEIIRTNDPTNAKGVLQHLLVIETLSSLRAFTQSEDPGQRQALLDEAAASLIELRKVGKLPEQQQVLWAYLGQFRAMLGQQEQAVEALNNAIEAAPQSELADQLKAMLDAVNQQ